MHINLKVAFFLSQAFARACFAAERPGAIINIASLLSFQGGVRIASYTASKSGMAGLTRLLSNKWSGRGIGVNAVAPRYVVTNNADALRKDGAGLRLPRAGAEGGQGYGWPSQACRNRECRKSE